MRGIQKTLIIALLITLGIGGFYAFNTRETVPAEPPATTDTLTRADASENTDTPEAIIAPDALPDNDMLDEIALGAADAPVTIYEYSSLTCPHCAAFHQNTLPLLKKKYIDEGLVRIVFQAFPFDPLATTGAMLAHCAPETKRVILLNVLFARQAIWAQSQDPLREIKKIAKQIGIFEDDINACLRNERILQGIRERQATAYENLDVRSTPTFFIDGQKIVGNQSLEVFEKIIDPLLSDRK